MFGLNRSRTGGMTAANAAEATASAPAKVTIPRRNSKVAIFFQEKLPGFFKPKPKKPSLLSTSREVNGSMGSASAFGSKANQSVLTRFRSDTKRNEALLRSLSIGVGDDFEMVDAAEAAPAGAGGGSKKTDRTIDERCQAAQEAYEEKMIKGYDKIEKRVRENYPTLEDSDVEKMVNNILDAKEQLFSAMNVAKFSREDARDAQEDASIEGLEGAQKRLEFFHKTVADVDRLAASVNAQGKIFKLKRRDAIVGKISEISHKIFENGMAIIKEETARFRALPGDAKTASLEKIERAKEIISDTGILEDPKKAREFAAVTRVSRRAGGRFNAVV